jgi:hypothetical protein
MSWSTNFDVVDLQARSTSSSVAISGRSRRSGVKLGSELVEQLVVANRDKASMGQGAGMTMNPPDTNLPIRHIVPYHVV